MLVSAVAKGANYQPAFCVELWYWIVGSACRSDGWRIEAKTELRAR